MVLSVFNRFSYQLPSQFETDFIQALSPKKTLPARIREEVHKFLDNSSWTFSHRRTWRYRDILWQSLAFVSKLHELKTVEKKPFFQEISEITDFVLGVQQVWIDFQKIVMSGGEFPPCQQKRPFVPLRFDFEKTIRVIDQNSRDTLQRLVLLGYSKQELCSLIPLEGRLDKVASHAKKLSLHEAKVLSILGQLDYRKESQQRKALILTSTFDPNGAMNPRISFWSR